MNMSAKEPGFAAGLMPGQMGVSAQNEWAGGGGEEGAQKIISFLEIDNGPFPRTIAPSYRIQLFDRIQSKKAHTETLEAQKDRSKLKTQSRRRGWGGEGSLGTTLTLFAACAIEDKINN